MIEDAPVVQDNNSSPSMSDDEQDAEGEEDEDYDVESQAPEDEDDEEPARKNIPAHSTTRPGKRKASMDEDHYMKQNPELYGLRRSVSQLRSYSAAVSLTTTSIASSQHDMW